MKKRIVTIALVIALLCTCFAGTYAYLQDTDAAKNTMTVGNVYIEQYEHKLVDGKLVDLGTSPTMHLMPVVYTGNGNYPTADVEWHHGNQYENLDTSDGTALLERWTTLWDEPNVVDKIVSVTNTGEEDDNGAYVRTIIALPAEVEPYVVLNITTGSTWKQEDLGTVEYADDTWSVIMLTYIRADGILEPGQSTGPSLMQVLLTNDVGNDEINDKYDAGFDILVVSQAVQAAGFTNATQALNAAFGEPNVTNIPAWLAKTK